MRTQEKFSAKIEKIAKLHKEKRLRRILCIIEYYWLKFRNRPMPFKWVDTEGEVVGTSIPVYHLALHDMMPHAVCGVMTGKVLLTGLRANAIQILNSELINDWNCQTTIQPRWV